jgi:chlorobactene glucosyltransferase
VVARADPSKRTAAPAARELAAAAAGQGRPPHGPPLARRASEMPGPIELLWALPWILFAAIAPLVVRWRPRLADSPPPPRHDAPLVSIIVPARNEAENISACIATLTNTLYPNREIIVVDDGSEDGTTDIARILAARSNGAIRLIEGAPLPDGWLGKCWACWQGYQAARGQLLLFTDADTRHDDELLGRAVGALARPGVELVTTLPRQLMESFWERVVLPHIFTLLALRYRDPRRVNRARNPRDVLANGQFILMRRATYEALGGHEAVRGEVVEDVRLAQRVVRAGGRIYLAHAADLMETRMYRSLDAIIEGWSKNLAQGIRGTVTPALQLPLPWIVGVLTIGFWTVPPLLFMLSLLTPLSANVGSWAMTATFVSFAFWAYIHARMGVPIRHALFFPLGAFIAGALFLRSALQGRRVRWKGRTYDIDGMAP